MKKLVICVFIIAILLLTPVSAGFFDVIADFFAKLGKAGETPDSECEENWDCGSWSECVNGEQERDCIDLNNCGTINERPTLIQSCDLDESVSELYCQQLYDLAISLQGKKCGDAEYDKIADVNKDTFISPMDAMQAVNHQEEEMWCKDKLLTEDDPCQPEPAIGPNCQQLYDLAISLQGKQCGDAEYDKIADVNKDTFISPMDAMQVVNHQEDERWCKDKLLTEEDPCQPEPAIGPKCQELYDLTISLQGKKCGDAEYDKIADLNKDTFISPSDSIWVVNKVNRVSQLESENWCMEKLDDNTNHCPSVSSNGYLQLSTLKDDYTVGERVELTDPPLEIGGLRVSTSDPLVDFSNTPTDPLELIKSQVESENEQLGYDGYIVQLKEKPVLKRRAEEKKKIEKYEIKSEIIDTSGVRIVYNGPKKVYYNYKKNNLEESLSQKMEAQKDKLKDEHDSFKSKIDTSKIKIEFDSVFNGISMDISDEEAKALESLPEVEKVYPNYLMHLDLMDSIPLMGADDVWRLDGDGNDCSVSGKECLTGKNVTIAIIDTGVDYTHPDLGNCDFEQMANFSDGIQDFSLDSSINPPDSYEYQYNGGWYYHFQTWRLLTIPSGAEKISVHIKNFSKSNFYSYLMIHDSKEDLLRSGFENGRLITSNLSDFWITVISNKTIKINSVIVTQDAVQPDFSSQGFSIDKIAIGNLTINWSKCDSKVIGGYNIGEGNEDPMDSYMHGTHVASIAAGNGVLKGVAPDAKIYAYKVSKSISNTLSTVDLITATRYVIDPNQDGDYSDHADVASMSIGGPGGPDTPLSQAVDNVVENGVVFTISAGNSGPLIRTVGSPSDAKNALSVAAVCKQSLIGTYSRCPSSIASFSSRGPAQFGQLKPEVAAPGAQICAARASFYESWQDYYGYCSDDKHLLLDGTSMAAPHVAGAAALIKQAHPSWTSKEIKKAIEITSSPLTGNKLEEGFGLINVTRAVLLEEAPPLAHLYMSDYLTSSPQVQVSFDISSCELAEQDETSLPI